LSNTITIAHDQVIDIAITAISFDTILSSKILSIYAIRANLAISNRFDYRANFEIALLNYCEKLINWVELNSFEVKSIDVVWLKYNYKIFNFFLTKIKDISFYVLLQDYYVNIIQIFD